MKSIKETVQEAQQLVENAQYIYINAGAGMSADLGTATYWTGKNNKYAGTVDKSGLTALQHATEMTWDTHRKEQIEYFHKTYNIFQHLHQHNKENHYTSLLSYLNKENKEYFVQTSNVDSAFYNYGYNEDALYEAHGSYRYSQCLAQPQEHGIYPTNNNVETYTPCPTCGSDSRPNALFFDDYKYQPDIAHVQRQNKYIFEEKLQTNNAVLIEIGAGTTVPTIRNHTLRINAGQDIPVIRINASSHEDDIDGISALIKPSAIAPILELKTKAQTGLKILVGTQQQ
jgi:NAD-dependent SIR2 family protein deacetylase